MRRFLISLLAVVALPTAVNAEFVPYYATEAERGRAQLNLDRIKKYIDRYNSQDATDKDKCKALWSIAWIANANEEPLDYWAKSDESWYDFAKRMRTKFIKADCPTISNLSNPF